jgi:hypothetical protein
MVIDKLMKVLSIVILFILLTSCEGFKVLTLTNVSGADATVTVKPGIGLYDKSKISNYPEGTIRDSLTTILPQDSSMVLLSIFTSMIAGSKLKASDLRVDYLRIETRNDTIVANSRQQIIDLIHDKRTRYQRNSDKAMINERNFGNIFIRE